MSLPPGSGSPGRSRPPSRRRAQAGPTASRSAGGATTSDYGTGPTRPLIALMTAPRLLRRGTGAGPRPSPPLVALLQRARHRHRSGPVRGSGTARHIRTLALVVIPERHPPPPASGRTWCRGRWDFATGVGLAARFGWMLTIGRIFAGSGWRYLWDQVAGGAGDYYLLDVGRGEPYLTSRDVFRLDSVRIGGLLAGGWWNVAWLVAGGQCLAVRSGSAGVVRGV